MRQHATHASASLQDPQLAVPIKASANGHVRSPTGTIQPGQIFEIREFLAQQQKGKAPPLR